MKLVQYHNFENVIFVHKFNNNIFMKEQFHNSSILSKEKLKQLTQRNDKPAFLKFTLMFITAIAMNVLVITTWNSSWFYVTRTLTPP